MSFLADLLAKIGISSATAGTQGCYILLLDEPTAPKCLIEK